MSLYKILSTSDGSVQTEIMKHPSKISLVNFKIVNRDIYIGDIPILQNGKFVSAFIQVDEILYRTENLPLIERTDLVNLGITDLSIDPYSIIEKLYENFNEALDTRVSSIYKGNFVSEPPKSGFTISSENKDHARILLEGYVLLAGMQGFIPWIDEKKFYWKSKTHPKLVVFRDMVKGRED